MGSGPCVEQMFAPGLREPKTKTAGASVGKELSALMISQPPAMDPKAVAIEEAVS